MGKNWYLYLCRYYDLRYGSRQFLRRMELDLRCSGKRRLFIICKKRGNKLRSLRWSVWARSLDAWSLFSRFGHQNVACAENRIDSLFRTVSGAWHCPAQNSGLQQSLPFYSVLFSLSLPPLSGWIERVRSNTFVFIEDKSISNILSIFQALSFVKDVGRTEDVRPKAN